MLDRFDEIKRFFYELYLLALQEEKFYSESSLAEYYRGKAQLAKTAYDYILSLDQ